MNFTPETLIAIAFLVPVALWTVAGLWLRKDTPSRYFPAHLETTRDDSPADRVDVNAEAANDADIRKAA